jgi:hypothetical protein
MTLIAGSLHLPAGSSAQALLSVTAPDVTLNGQTFDGTGNSQGYGSAIWATAAHRLHVANFRATHFRYGGVMLWQSHTVLIEQGYIGQISPGSPVDLNAYGVAFSATGGGADGFSSGIAQDLVIEDIPSWMGMNAHNASDMTWQRITCRRVRRAFFADPDGSYVINNAKILFCRAEAQSTVQPGGYFIGNSSNSTFADNYLSNTYGAPGDGGEWVQGIRDYGGASTNLVRVRTTRGT